jgi:hypothetical protein
VEGQHYKSPPPRGRKKANHKKNIRAEQRQDERSKAYRESGSRIPSPPRASVAEFESSHQFSAEIESKFNETHYFTDIDYPSPALLNVVLDREAKIVEATTKKKAELMPRVFGKAKDTDYTAQEDGVVAWILPIGPKLEVPEFAMR